ncbi:MAG: type IV secretion system protein VirB3 [Alphaproteobacteria bacterium]|nr:type IV secretion system protein VirB3 [Alphaproteobacteria bacterium]
MAESGHLQADPLFQGLTRPAMIMGVSYMFFVLNSVINLVMFINTSDFKILFLCAPLVHAIGYLICMKEPRAIELLMIKSAKTWKLAPVSKVRTYHGFTNSYDLF